MTALCIAEMDMVTDQFTEAHIIEHMNEHPEHRDRFLLLDTRYDNIDSRIDRLSTVTGVDDRTVQGAARAWRSARIPIHGKLVDERTGLRVYKAETHEIYGSNARYLGFSHTRLTKTVEQEYFCDLDSTTTEARSFILFITMSLIFCFKSAHPSPPIFVAVAAVTW